MNDPNDDVNDLNQKSKPISQWVHKRIQKYGLYYNKKNENMMMAYNLIICRIWMAKLIKKYEAYER